jgi:hypothetical protein
MSKQIILGKDQAGKPVLIDLKALLRTRFLVQAASGGGKSQTLRRLAEQIFGKVPVWIIDKEDEFPSLRDKFGYIFSGPGGETPTDPRSAELVCERLLKAKASAIFGLYSLKDPVRHEWVRIFLNALMNAPKSLWTNVIVMVDEAHKFCPEKGQGESVAKDAMTDLAVDGRKRGFCSGFFTQRLGKLSKNASAELLNRLVGKTVEDIDVDRAVDLMSVRRGDRQEFEEGIKRLKPGNFWCFGDAISTDRILVHVGPIQTKHPEPGEPTMATLPPLPEKMKALLPQLADLPKEAETKAKNEADLRAENRSLRAQLVAKPKEVTVIKAAPVTKTEIRKVEIPVVKEADLKRVEKCLGRAEKLLEKLGEFGKPVEEAAKTLKGSLGALRVTAAVPKLSMAIPPTRIPVKPLPVAQPMVASDNGDVEKPLLAGERKMLEVLAKFYPGSRTKAQIAQLAGYALSGGTYGNYYSNIKKGGFIQEKSDNVTITEKGLEFFGGRAPEGPTSTAELLSMWRDKLIAGERKLLDALVEVYPNPLTKEALGRESGYESSGGTFGNYLSTLRRNDLAVVEGDLVRAHEGLFQLTG